MDKDAVWTKALKSKGNHMKSFIFREVVGPLVARIGTVVATYLVVEYALDPDAANAIATGIGAALGVGYDLVARKVLLMEGR